MKKTCLKRLDSKQTPEELGEEAATELLKGGRIKCPFNFKSSKSREWYQSFNEKIAELSKDNPPIHPKISARRQH